MTLVEHLEELRRVLIVSLVCWLVGSVIGVAISGAVLDLLVRPLQYLHQPLHYFGPMGFFTIHLKVGLVVGLVIALPAIMHQAWTFVAPGLKPSGQTEVSGPDVADGLTVIGSGLVGLPEGKSVSISK